MNITPKSPYDALFYHVFSHYYELQYSVASNGTSAVITVYQGDAFVPIDLEPPTVFPSYYPYLVVNGVPRFLNISPTWGNPNLKPWWYEFRFSVWKNHYELLWQRSPPEINSSIAYYLNGSCWGRITGFHNSSGFVVNGTVEGNYMVFRFNGTTLRIPLTELAKYYPPEVWGWRLVVAKDGTGYLIIPTTGFDYTDLSVGLGVILGRSDYIFLVDNSSGVYALYYVNRTLKPAFDLLRLMSPRGDLVRGLLNPYVNSSLTFELCSSQGLGYVNTSKAKVTKTNSTPTTTKEKTICGPGLVVFLTTVVLAFRRFWQREE